ncbi:MAG: succinate dehydrogenase, hydrophobic membrane anchor protein [Deltaproteobacteria bacterium]|nr:succinate dehydrogenase, hydrophobic membrane anchor protein [Deltaproteobacteria bacterium]
MAFVDQRRPGGILLWFLQRLTAAGLLILLLAHFYILHYYHDGFVTYRTVAARLASPYWKAFDILFLTLAVFHGFNGLRTVVLEYIHREPLQQRLILLLWTVALVLLSIGVYSVAVFTVQS